MCKVEGCERQAVAQEFCLNHYKQAKRRGEIQNVIKPKSGTCEVEGCSKNVYADGKCSKHYRQIQRKNNNQICSVEGCSKPHLALGYCNKHYQQYQKYGEIPGPKPKKEKPKKEPKRPKNIRECGKCGEVKKIHGHGLCRLCYARSKSFERNGYNHKRRERIRSTSEKFTKQQVLDKTNGNCGICGLHIDLMLKRPNMNSFSIDHILPISKGGSHTLENVQAAHLLCNCLKQSRVD